jgi:hypothetical protein
MSQIVTGAFIYFQAGTLIWAFTWDAVLDAARFAKCRPGIGTLIKVSVITILAWPWFIRGALRARP